MKRLYFIFCALCVCLLVSAQSKKIETFNKNTWNWIVEADKFHSVDIEDGLMIISYKKFPKPTKTTQKNIKNAIVFWAKHMSEFTKNDKKGAHDESQRLFDEVGYGGTYISGYYFPEGFYSVKTFAKLPINASANFKLTVTYIQPSVSFPIYAILFNANRDCLNNDDDPISCLYDRILISNTGYCISYQDATNKVLKSGNFPTKLSKGSPMTLYMERKNDRIIIELNGIEILNDKCKLTEAGFGFQLHNKATLKIDEIIIEQANQDDD